ncbi:MAG: homocysteine S-methyltransferase family protein [Clostridia bacterium]|nr:homocysteine S-methyltransferase family protein [Clostridia bacterium]
MGTMLQKAGLKLGEIPEALSITHPEIIIDIHKQYINAGSEIIYTNTFGANALKLKNSKYTVKEIVEKSIENARIASNKNALVALDIGPLGELLEPSGTLSFDDAYSYFKEIVSYSKGADLIVFETFSDLYELKAGILAVKENCNLPVMCSMSFEKNGRTFTGVLVESFAKTAVGLGADAVGINCSLGPKEILPLAKTLCDYTPENFPVFVKPNAGLPHSDGSGYDLTSDDFAKIIDLYMGLGVIMVGGCCGTTPEYIEKTCKVLNGKKPCDKPSNNASIICSATKIEKIECVAVVGERINPTGKKRFQQALRENDLDYILTQATEQVNAGAQILDVNVGIPEIDETTVLTQTVKSIQSIIDLPLQLDSSSSEALEKALRYYNGSPIVNSVNGEEKSLKSILPLCKKYGASVIGLTLDENGIPNRAEDRFKIAEKIVNTALSYGIAKKDIYIDTLTMTISADKDNAIITLDALEMVKNKLGVKTALGVSNVSFGLPCRENINATFLTLALSRGLDLAIINPNSEEMMARVLSFLALTAKDENCKNYVARYKQTQESAAKIESQSTEKTLKDCVIQGLKGKSAEIAQSLLKTFSPLDIVDNELIPALDEVGSDYEKGVKFLPELLSSATAAQSAFEVIKEHIAKTGTKSASKGQIVLATVKGDVHDIGKNIVKVVLENYGYTIFDLGRDVEPQKILDTILEKNIKLVGLSALMTTTVKSMEETIKLIKQNSDCKIMVGGAVLTEDYALKIGADYFAKDAKQSADIAKKFFNN